MTESAKAVFAFTQDEDFYVFPSPEAAASWMEAIDVEAGEYAALYDTDGRVISVGTSDGVVVLRPTERVDLSGLRERLEQLQEQHAIQGPLDDPALVASTRLEHAWATRWPKRPRWLDKRLHGEGPYMA